MRKSSKCDLPAHGFAIYVFKNVDYYLFVWFKNTKKYNSPLILVVESIYEGPIYKKSR
jgi:hypothetical protein